LASVVNADSINEEFNGWVSFDFVSLCGLFLDCGIDLTDDDTIFFDHFGEFFIVWSHSLAVATPWGEKLYHDVLV
jgi:hypothetical protein